MDSQIATSIAESKIAEALRSSATALDLSVKSATEAKLTALPEFLSELKQLVSLDVSGHGLKVLPDWLSRLSKLRKLSLKNNQLNQLPDGLKRLTELVELNVANNELKRLPDWFGELRKLWILNLSQNHLEDLPESFSGLVGLELLFLWRNEFKIFPPALCKLPKLESLDLSQNELSWLPEDIGELTTLEGFDLSDNVLTTLPASISNLTTLEELNLGSNSLTSLSDLVGKLSGLRILGLEYNRLKQLPTTLGHLKNLESLDLTSNDLDSLPESLTQLPLLKSLWLHDNPKLGLSADILGPEYGTNSDPRAILAFYFSQRKQNSRPLNEVKLLLVGHGRVGKTSLSKALRGVAHDDREPETPGIERHSLSLTTRGSNITAHIWDFGGQEFLHQTHQFFFSERSIYLVVLSGRQGRPMQEAEYWLRLIRTYGTGSPVVIALNQIKAHPFTIDEYFLQENYPEVKAVVKTDCDPRTGIEALKKLFGKLAGQMPSVREKIDPSWARVRGRLEEMKASFVTFAEYRQICSEESVETAENQETLATILDCLGIALNYRRDPRLRDTSVLKPRWLVDGIYMILRWLHKQETNGVMRLADFPKALKSKKDYPPEMHRFLLALMEKFELCFALDNDEEEYLVPGLLSENQPGELKRFMSRDAQRIQLRYDDVRPPGLLPRFIVRSHTLSEAQPRWLRGVVLTRRSARALVRGDHEGKVTDVFAIGDSAEDRIWVTEFILSEMRSLNEKLPVRTFVEDKAGVWTELEILREAVRRDETTRTERTADGSTVNVNVLQRLREVESPEASSPSNSPLSLFICYARDNERTVKRLIPSLKVLARRGYITPWRDTDLIPGEDWDDTIKHRLSESQIILFMVSRDFLASEYITEHERPLAIDLMKKKKAVVVPVLLSKCSWDDEDFAKLEKLPRKDDLISSITPREDAWFLVEEGLKKVVDRMRGSEVSVQYSPRLRH